MIESGGDGGRSHASAFPPGLDDRPEAAGTAADATPGAGGGPGGTGPGTGAASGAGLGPGVDGVATGGGPAGEAVDVAGGLGGLGDLDGLDGVDGAAGGAGTEAVRAALAPLERLATLPVRAHVAVFEQVFTELEATLATVAGEGRAEAAAARGDLSGLPAGASSHGAAGP